MKNYTKALAEQIVAVMDRYNNYEELEKIVICYGMELFLNSILKISIYFVIGFSIGKGNGGREYEKKSSKTRIFYYMLYYKYHYCFLPLDYCR